MRWGWGEKRFSLKQADEGFSRISGTTGSGKSHLLKLHLSEVLGEIETNPHAKLVLYEPKREFYAWLCSLGLISKIAYFMPSDERSVALDFAEDYSDENDAKTLAYAFYPERAGGHEAPFWGKCMRTIFAGVYRAILAKLGRADLRLVCLVLENEELTRKVLSFDPYYVQARNLVGLDPKSTSDTMANIQLTVQSQIGEMKVLAAQMDCAARERDAFSLRRFLSEEGSGILVISKDDTYGMDQDAMNGVLMLRLTQLLDGMQHDPQRKVYIVIDEFPALCGKNRCPGVETMFLRLRSRGALPLITDQGLSTLKPIYGDDTTAILGQCSNVVFLRQPDLTSAEDAAKYLGVERGYEEVMSRQSGEQSSRTRTPQWYDRTIIPVSDLMTLYPASEQRGIEGWAKSALDSEKRPYPVAIAPTEVKRIPATRRKLFKEYEQRGPSSQRLRQLEPEERKALETPTLSSTTPEKEFKTWVNFATN